MSKRGNKASFNPTLSSLDYNGQVERMNRTIKEATVYRYYYVSSEKLKQHLKAFLNAQNFAKQLKTLKGLTPYEFIQNCWTNQPKRFKINPSHLNMKPYK